ncbi:MAG: non-canonical purine NTP pyrophosphatase, RdgB/HAM1 family [Prochlorococcus sp. SP3034]|nr:non-canonical purine NTP pyrophosphatase, RdgB/HAM1 family [Prochlorococcus sp. SP3034]|tara:strand:+ start:16928 stop:17506 length:579 start_codon:yes stop_codon:yes gene_type:complete
MKKILYVASKNPGKIKEYQKMLGIVNCKLLMQPESIEVIEDGNTFGENAKKKAYKVSTETKNYSIADDSGLCIDSLGGSPGIYSSRFACDDQKRIERVLKELDGEKNRSAFFIAHVCLADPYGKIILRSEAKCFGNILLEPRGEDGFGYDPIFEEINSKLSFAEMENNIKDFYSHRGKALKKIIPDLKKIFN